MQCMKRVTSGNWKTMDTLWSKVCLDNLVVHIRPRVDWYRIQCDMMEKQDKLASLLDRISRNKEDGTQSRLKFFIIIVYVWRNKDLFMAMVNYYPFWLEKTNYLSLYTCGHEPEGALR